MPVEYQKSSYHFALVDFNPTYIPGHHVRIYTYKKIEAIETHNYYKLRPDSVYMSKSMYKHVNNGYRTIFKVQNTSLLEV